MFGVTRRLLELGVMLCSILPLAGCGGSDVPFGLEGSAHAESGAARLPVISLDEKRTFPLERHVESADIAAGKWSFGELFSVLSRLVSEQSGEAVELRA